MIIGRGAHGAISHIQPHQTESRINHCALPTPFRSISDKHAFTNEWIEGTDHEVTFGKYALGVAHDFLHC